ncbi:MAG: DUF1801 domain-containing protein [Brooklawnia sp.]|uniref:DUF1801 domain-containing protein n=1 Tax=Brooklawnia sp. TaxID=2699740 RepID=UPI003C733EAF
MGTKESGQSGKPADEARTRPTELDPDQYIASLDSPRRVAHGRLLLEIFNRVTGVNPVMWGPSMIGYGQVHYRYDSGREGDMFKLGFSPRKAKLSLYGLPHDQDLLGRLGKHTTGADCIYVNKPEDIDLDVLEELIRRAWDAPG